MRVRHLLLLLVIVSLGFVGCDGGKNKFTVKGTVTGMPAQKVFLEEFTINEMTILDSATSNAKGEFKLTGNASEPGLYRIRYASDRYMLLSIDKGDVTVTGTWSDFENYTVSGSEASENLQKFLLTVREHLRDFNTMSTVIDTLKVRGNDTLLSKATNDMQEMNIQFTRYIENYADTTKHLPNALFAVQMLNPQAEKDYLAVFVQSMNSRFPNAKLAKDFTAKYQQLVGQGATPAAASGVKVGNVAPDITLADVNGKQVTLASFKGKYVLIDFWASWCGPCRAENPNVVAAYNKFKDKNFTILGVSLDSDKDKWLAAIKKDNLTWTHISDLQGWESIAARTYGVQSIPANFLVGPDGKIIDRDLRGEALEAVLADALK